ARCPFRYFSDHVLHLEPTTLPESVDTISPLDLGALVHDILEATLRTLREHGYFTEKPTTGPDPGAMLEEVARRSFDQYANTHSIGYPLVWECLQHSLVSTLLAIVWEELESMSTEGWEPILFEHPMRGNLTLTLGPKSESLPVAGRPDRIDWHAPWNRYRIVDYKFKSSKRPDTMDSNLVLGAIRGQRLQPPLYLVMTQATLPSQRRQERSGQAPNCEGAWFHYVAPNWNHEDGRVLTREQFPADAWYTQLRAPLERVLSFLAGGIRSGMFFIQPGTYCGSCDYRLICRRSHQPSVCRARSDRVYVQPHRALRLTQPPQAKKATRSDRAASTGTLIQVTERGPQSGRDA
ncbi:MAG: PD-(D/E)XK nuclease family protein, partial [Nitrospiraceae bacterium]